MSLIGSPDRTYRLSMPFGLAVHGSGAIGDLSELIEEADRAMYRHKHRTKNQHRQQKVTRG